MRVRSHVVLALILASLGCVTPNRPIKGTGPVDSSTSVDDGGLGVDVGSSPSDGPRVPDSPLDVSTQLDTPGSPADAASTSRDGVSVALDMGGTDAHADPPGAPFVTATPRSPTNNTKPTWTWMSGGNGGSGLFRFRLDVNDLNQNATMGIQSSFTPAQPLSEGSHTLYVQERNAAGEWSASGSAEVIVDVTPPKGPVFLAVPRSPLNSVTPTWKWMSGGGGDGTYRCKIDDAGLDVGATTLTVAEFMHGASLSEAVHTLFVQERDTAGNWSQASSRSIALSRRRTVGAAAFSAGAADWTVIKFSPDGVPYVAFTDGGRGGKATVMRFSSDAWEAVGTAGFSPGFAGDLSFSFSPTGAPYIAFSAEVGAGMDYGPAHVMRWTGSGWEMVGAAGFSPGVARGLDIAIASDGSPYVSFTDESNMNRATVMRFNGTTWQKIGGAAVSAAEAQDVFLKLNSKDVPYLCFTDGSTVRGTVMRFGGTSWELVGPPELVPESAQNCSLAFSSTDELYVAFQHSAADHRATVLRFINGRWQPVGKPRFSPNAVQWVSLALDKGDSPYVAFTDGASAKVGVMKFSGDTWEFVGPTGLSDGTAFVFPHSLAISPAGIPHVAFQDAVNGNRVTVLRTSFDP